MSEFRIFETAQYLDDLKKIYGAREGKIVKKLDECVYPQIKEQPYCGKNIKKLRDYSPETWRYRIGEARFFYEIDEERKIVFMLTISLRSKSYRKS